MSTSDLIEKKRKPLIEEAQILENRLQVIRIKLELLEEMEKEECTPKPAPLKNGALAIPTTNSVPDDAGSVFDAACRVMLSMDKPFSRVDVEEALRRTFPRPFSSKTLDRPLMHLMKKTQQIVKVRDNVGNHIPALYRVTEEKAGKAGPVPQGDLLRLGSRS